MNFKIFLESLNLNDPDRLTDFILKNCQPFLNQCDGKALYRGVSKMPEEPFIKKPRKDRTPLSTDIEISNAIDTWFQKNYDIKPRAEGLFCHAKMNKATYYSNGSDALIVFPIGNFKSLGFKNLDKKEETSGEFLSDSVVITRNVSQKIWYDKLPPDEAISDVLKSFPLNFKLKELINGDAEITIMCDEYVAIPNTYMEYLGYGSGEAAIERFIKDLTKNKA